MKKLFIFLLMLPLFTRAQISTEDLQNNIRVKARVPGRYIDNWSITLEKLAPSVITTIGSGTGVGSGVSDYNLLTNKPTIPTSASQVGAVPLSYTITQAATDAQQDTKIASTTAVALQQTKSVVSDSIRGLLLNADSSMFTVTNGKLAIKQSYILSIIQSTSNVTPNAPTSGVVDDAANTFNWTASTTNGLTLSDYEYRISSTGSFSTVTAKPITVGNIAIASGQLELRVKAASSRNVSGSLFNTSPFTISSLLANLQFNNPTGFSGIFVGDGETYADGSNAGFAVSNQKMASNSYVQSTASPTQATNFLTLSSSSSPTSLDPIIRVGNEGGQIIVYTASGFFGGYGTAADNQTFKIERVNNDVLIDKCDSAGANCVNIVNTGGSNLLGGISDIYVKIYYPTTGNSSDVFSKGYNMITY